MKPLLWIITWVALSAVVSAPARAVIFYADKSLPAAIPAEKTYPTIKAALYAAHQEPGMHEVLIKNVGGVDGNVYYECFEMYAMDLMAYSLDHLTIKPFSPLDHIVIDAQGAGPCFVALECDDLTIENITFRNGDGELGNGESITDLSGGGLCLLSCRDVELVYCNFESNSAANGGGVYCEYSNVTFVSNSMTGNTAAGDGGAICAKSSVIYGAALTMDSNDAGALGGALWCGLDSQFRWINGQCVDNSAGTAGGAVYVADSSEIQICGNIPSTFPPNLVGSTWSLGHIETAGGTALVGAAAWNSTSLWSGYPYTVQPAGDCPAKMATVAGANLSVMNLPNRGGRGFCDAARPDGIGADATITVWGLPEGTSNDNIWLEFVGSPNVDFASADRHLHADFPVRYGRTEFRLSARGVGTSFPGVNRCFVHVEGLGALDPLLEVYFNSPDITGDGSVCLADLAVFLHDSSTGYNYRSDFVRDGTLILSDTLEFMQAYGLNWNSDIEPAACE